MDSHEKINILSISDKIPNSTICNVNLSAIKENFKLVEDFVKNIQNQDQLLNVLTSDDFIKAITVISTEISNTKLNNLLCIAGVTDEKGKMVNSLPKEQICHTFNSRLNKLDVKELDHTMVLINKYQFLLNNLYNWIINNIEDIGKFCGSDNNKINKLKQLLNNLRYIISKQNNKIEGFGEERNGYIRYVVLGLLIIIIYLIISR